jgi:hypothetical protein
MNVQERVGGGISHQNEQNHKTHFIHNIILVHNGNNKETRDDGRRKGRKRVYVAMSLVLSSCDTLDLLVNGW